MLALVTVCCASGGAASSDACGAERLTWKPKGTRLGSLFVDGQPLIEVVGVDALGPLTLEWRAEALALDGRFPEAGASAGAILRLKHHVTRPRHIWVPHLSPTVGHVVGDHAFRSPAVILADDAVAVVLIPDLDDVAAGFADGWRTWLDYDHPARTVRLAAGNYTVDGHVFYRPAEVEHRGRSVRLRLHVVVSRRPDDIENPYGLAARWMWLRWGQPRHAQGGSQRAPLTTYMDYVVRWAFSDDGWGETVWQSFTIGDRKCGAPAFIVDVAQHPSVPVDQRKWREQRSVWNQAWFSTQRCANGLWRHARLTESRDLAERARLTTQLALAAPQTDGLFPAVYTTASPGKPKWYQLYKDTPDWSRGRWSNSDRRPAEASEQACHILDAAFTARLLLEWAAITGDDDEVLPYVERFADRLCRLQRPSGAFPGWVEPDGRVPAQLAEGPETAMGATLLFELAARQPERAQWREAATRAVDYLLTDPIPTARWEDYETYYSCNRWGTPQQMGKRVERNGVFKQNNLSIFWCAEACLAAYRVLGEERFLRLGRRLLDELSLYQQVWDPPFVAAPCHGGFGVMNADGEWNDARQSLFAPLYLEYYRTTGVREYFERGVAAVRASFAMMYCPENKQVRRQYELRHPFFGPESYGFMMENIAHGGPAPADGSAIGPFTIYTWGNGAALATAAKLRDLYGDLYIDTARKVAFGIDGCTAAMKGNTVNVSDRYGRSELTAVYANGTRRRVAIQDGQGKIPAAP